MNALHYTIQPVDPAAHLFAVSLRVEIRKGQAGPLTFALPAWIPGSYMIREFARHIVRIEAHCEHAGERRPVALTKRDKHTWEAAPCTGTLTLSWQVYAWDLSVRCAHLDRTHGFFNGTGVFLRLVGQEQVPHIVDIQRPDGEAYRHWRVATSLPTLRAKRFGFGTYRAADYDELVDHPVEMGTFASGSFEACGVTHDVAVTGLVPNLDMDRLCRDLRTICEAQIRFFEPRSAKAPFERYVFLVMAVGDGYGGLEHRASTALLCRRDALPARNAAAVASEPYAEFLGLASHEYFHAWNVKRIKPAAFAPYDFNQESYTALLWIFEGFTSYYDDLFLVRSGLIDEARYLKRLATTIGGVLRGPGRLLQSVAESSFDAWTKYYRQDENSPNAIVSYYAKGSLVALALDLHLRAASQGTKSLDDVMRLLWQRYGRNFYPANAGGLAEDGFPGLVAEATGVDVRREVRMWAYGTEDLPLARLLRPFGIRIEIAAEAKVPSLGIKLAAGEPRLAHVYNGGPAHAAGLSAGDVLVALDGLRVTASNLEGLLARYAAGETISVHAFRRDELLLTTVQLAASAPLAISLTLHGKAADTRTAGKVKPTASTASDQSNGAASRAAWLAGARSAGRAGRRAGRA